jgi:hypothetical protein
MAIIKPPSSLVSNSTGSVIDVGGKLHAHQFGTSNGSINYIISFKKEKFGSSH